MTPYDQVELPGYDLQEKGRMASGRDPTSFWAPGSGMREHRWSDYRKPSLQEEIRIIQMKKESERRFAR